MEYTLFRFTSRTSSYAFTTSPLAHLLPSPRLCPLTQISPPALIFFFILTLSLVLIFSTTDHTHASHTQLQIHSTSHHITTHINQPTYQSTNNYAVCTNFIRTNNTSNDDFFNHTPRRRRSPAQHDQRHHCPRRRTPRLASPSRRARTAASRQRGNADCRLGWNW
jgi:hypothetical protein